MHPHGDMRLLDTSSRHDTQEGGHIITTGFAAEEGATGVNDPKKQSSGVPCGSLCDLQVGQWAVYASFLNGLQPMLQAPPAT